MSHLCVLACFRYNVGCTKRMGLFPNRHTAMEKLKKQRSTNAAEAKKLVSWIPPPYLFRIIQVTGESWVCNRITWLNRVHIVHGRWTLSLYCSLPVCLSTLHCIHCILCQRLLNLNSLCVLHTWPFKHTLILTELLALLRHTEILSCC